MEFIYSVFNHVLSFLATPIISGVSLLGVILAALIFVLFVRFF